LLSIHETLAALTRVPEFRLSTDEASRLSAALVGVSKHYNVPAVAPYIIDHVNLGIVVLAIYGTRLTAIKIRREVEGSKPREVNPVQQPNGLPPIADFEAEYTAH
jgi:hypothetical protein